MIQEIIEQCQWAPTKLFFISDNVFDPLIYYSHFTPLILTLIFGAFIFLNGPRNILNQVLALIALCISTWLLGDLVLWATHQPYVSLFVWSLINMIEPIIYGLMVYFVYLFIEKKDLSFKYKLTIILALLPTILLTPTKFAILGFDLSNCDREAVEGIMVYYSYFIELIFSLWIVIYGLRSYFKNDNLNERKKVILIALGAVLFLLTFASGNIIGSLSVDWTIAQYGLFGIPVFIGFLSYLVVKFKTFNIKTLGAQLLIIALWIALFSTLFVQEISTIRKVIIATLIFFGILGIILINSVKKERLQLETIARLASDLEKSNGRLRELDRQKTEFVSLASHQLRAPLTATKGYVSMMLEGDYGKIPDNLAEPIKRIYGSTQSLIQIVGDFLDVSRIELGTMKYNFIGFDVGKLIEQITSELKPSIEISGLEFRFEKTEGEYPMLGDANKLRQVFSNLIDNALKYTKKGFVHTSLEKRGNKYLFTVKDSGVGIHKEMLPKLFDKFIRASNANEANVIGTGLGLYVARQMVEKHRGRIWVESEGEGKGSTFYVELASNV